MTAASSKYWRIRALAESHTAPGWPTMMMAYRISGYPKDDPSDFFRDSNAYASSEYGAAIASHAVDGLAVSYWLSDYHNPVDLQWICFENTHGYTTDIDRLEIDVNGTPDYGGAWPTKFALEYSTGGGAPDSFIAQNIIECPNFYSNQTITFSGLQAAAGPSPAIANYYARLRRQ